MTYKSVSAPLSSSDTTSSRYLELELVDAEFLAPFLGVGKVLGKVPLERAC